MKNKRKKGTILIGTSGWHYPHWKGPFYPEDMPSGDFLGFYRDRLHTVEINNSFYQLPEKSTLEGWRRAAGRGFVFAVKAGRYITHMKKLKEPEKSSSAFFRRVMVLKEKLGPVLFQLPPRWKCNVDRLAELLQVLPAGNRYAFEFRDHSWFNEQVYELLRRKNAAFCLYDLEGALSPKEITADFIYVRLHGPGKKYHGEYPVATLAGWAGAFSTWRNRGKDIYCYFNNDQKGYAVRNAMMLDRMFS